MPGFNGTGPAGLGPMTGGGRGQCASGMRGMGLGRGRGMGYFRGRAFQNRGIGFGNPMAEGEAEYLKGQIAGLAKELAEIKNALKSKEAGE